MAWTSIFSPKKVTPTNKKSPIQNLSASISNVGAYSPPMYTANVLKNAAGQAANTASSWLNRFNQPQQQGGMSKAPQMSVAPKQPIQGSGMSGQYASNPQNYQAKPQTPTPSTPTAPSPTADNTYMSDSQKLAQEQIDRKNQAQIEKENRIRQQYALSNQALQGSLPEAEAAYNEQKALTEQTIADLLAGGQRQKSQAQDYYGEAKRTAAQRLRETQGQTQRMFANLGTLDSRGEGSFGQATENMMSEFNRQGAQLDKDKANKLAEIDSTVSAAERQARQVLIQEQQKMAELKRNIQFAMANNRLAEADEIAKAYNESQDYIAQVQDGINNMKYQAALQRENIMNANKELQSLSPEFWATGKPVTAEDRAFFFKNPEKAGAYAGVLGQNTKLDDKGKMAAQGLNVLSDIRSYLQADPNINRNVNPLDPNQQIYQSSVKNMSDLIGRLRSGGAITAGEEQRFRQFLPGFMDSPETISSKLAQLESELRIRTGQNYNAPGTIGSMVGQGGLDSFIIQ